MSWLHHANCSPFIHSLDHIHEEQELEVQAEQARAETPTNLALDQGKHQCISPNVHCILFLITIYVLD
jgi:hypothetical protein